MDGWIGVAGSIGSRREDEEAQFLAAGHVARGGGARLVVWGSTGPTQLETLTTCCYFCRSSCFLVEVEAIFFVK